MAVLRTSGKELHTSNKADAHIVRQKPEIEKKVKKDLDKVKEEPQSLQFYTVHLNFKSKLFFGIPIWHVNA